MSTILITYSTPPPPAAAKSPDDRDAPEPTHAADATSAQLMVAGIDEAIAETIATGMARAGHQVICRPCVAKSTTERGFDLVVVVDNLHVTHRSDTSWPRVAERVEDTPPYAARRAGGEATQGVRQQAAASLGEATIPMTWCADFRAVEAWGRSIADHLVHFLELRAELVRVRAELVRCRALLKAVTPEPRAASAVELGRPVGAARPLHPGARHAATGQARTERR
ncbi:MAG: hypothetical protein HOP97_08045 [Terrabacter sp.]|nr:hypothetical protein [Dermatophilaceae bacterium]NUS08517.1 hypothetical protein [Nonomuraea sp.]NUS41562.1 hypothetical protein [Terrabacter sp.]